MSNANIEFSPGAIWKSSRGSYYRILSVDYDTGQTKLRIGLKGRGRVILKQKDNTKGWTFVAPCITGELLDMD